MIILSTSRSSVGIILDVRLELDNLECGLNLEVFRRLQLLQVSQFECFGLTELSVEEEDSSQGRGETEEEQGHGDMGHSSVSGQSVEVVANLGMRIE